MSQHIVAPTKPVRRLCKRVVFDDVADVFQVAPTKPVRRLCKRSNRQELLCVAAGRTNEAGAQALQGRKGQWSLRWSPKSHQQSRCAGSARPGGELSRTCFPSRTNKAGTQALQAVRTLRARVKELVAPTKPARRLCKPDDPRPHPLWAVTSHQQSRHAGSASRRPRWRAFPVASRTNKAGTQALQGHTESTFSGQFFQSHQQSRHAGSARYSALRCPSE